MHFSKRRFITLLAAFFLMLTPPTQASFIPSKSAFGSFVVGAATTVLIAAALAFKAMRNDERTTILLSQNSTIPANVLKNVERKIGELSAWQGSRSLIRNYLEWVMKYPFNKLTETHPTLHDAITQLNKTHTGICDAKESIIDYLAGLHMSSTQQPKILCLYGGPGIGKTTFAESIADALGKKFTKISFGAIKSLSSSKSISEQHSSAPGPIAKALITSGVLDPVILLDELEKAPTELTTELLELLDPAQNKTFKDTYLDFEMDLSKVTFVASINDINKLPSPLRDRMQIINMHPYSRKERIEIAQTKLIPEISKNFMFSAEIQEKLQNLAEPLVEKIARYEFGVRNLKRALIIAAEKYARQLLLQKELETAAEITTISASEVLASLDPEILQTHPATCANTEDCVGIVNGMYAHGCDGGGLLKVEVVINSNGKGNLSSSGLLGKTSLESEKRVFAYVKSIARTYNINPEIFSNSDFVFGDQHYQEVDGPSAGIAQTVALISALTGRTVKQNFAVTGAIDMHGNALPVGGYRAKILGTEQAGIQNIVVPESARPTIEVLRKDFPDLNIFYVSTVPQALELLLNPAS